jgi:hypothetical protein
MPFQIRNTDSAMQNYITEIGERKRKKGVGRRKWEVNG